MAHWVRALQRESRSGARFGGERLPAETVPLRPHGGPRPRLAGAPISWGVCEVPGWGRVLPPARVLSQMAALGADVFVAALVVDDDWSAPVPLDAAGWRRVAARLAELDALVAERGLT